MAPLLEKKGKKNKKRGGGVSGNSIDFKTIKVFNNHHDLPVNVETTF
jgi:hypothetical protein